MKGLDIAAVTTWGLSEEDLQKGIVTSEEEEEAYRESSIPCGRDIYADNIFIGSSSGKSIDEMEKRHNRFTGVAKERRYNPSPILYTKEMEIYGKDMNFYSDKELKEIFGIAEGDSAEIIYTEKWETPENMKKYEEVRSKPLSEKEIMQIREDINKAREDVDTMAKSVLKEVWNL